MAHKFDMCLDIALFPIWFSNSKKKQHQKMFYSSALSNIFQRFTAFDTMNNNLLKYSNMPLFCSSQWNHFVWYITSMTMPYAQCAFQIEMYKPRKLTISLILVLFCQLYCFTICYFPNWTPFWMKIPQNTETTCGNIPLNPLQHLQSLSFFG